MWFIVKIPTLFIDKFIFFQKTGYESCLPGVQNFVLLFIMAHRKSGERHDTLSCMVAIKTSMSYLLRKQCFSAKTVLLQIVYSIPI